MGNKSHRRERGERGDRERGERGERERGDRTERDERGDRDRRERDERGDRERGERSERGDQGERRVPLQEEARGLYQAQVSWEGPVLVSVDLPGSVSLPPTVLRAQASPPVPLELQGALEDREALGLLARATGGVVEPSAEELFGDLKTRLQSWSLWPWFAWLALVAFLADVAIRRLRIPGLVRRSQRLVQPVSDA